MTRLLIGETAIFFAGGSRRSASCSLFEGGQEGEQSKCLPERGLIAASPRNCIGARLNSRLSKMSLSAYRPTPCIYRRCRPDVTGRLPRGYAYAFVGARAGQ